MPDNTTFYIIATIIIAHFVIGFIFLVRKLSGPVKEEGEEIQNEEEVKVEP